MTTPATHYYGHIGDGHVRGRRVPAPLMLDPVSGAILGTLGESTPAVVNTIIRGSAAAMRVTRVVSAGTYIGELLNPYSFVAGEAVTYDSGGTALVTPVLDPVNYQGNSLGIVAQHGDAERNSFIPTDQSDPIWWDRQAKLARTLTVSGATGAFYKGDRCTTSGGAAFTVLALAINGSNVDISIVRATGTFTVGHTITNTTTTGSATIAAVGDDSDTGMFVQLHLLPNLNGTGTLYEFTPKGEATDNKDLGASGFTAPFARRAVERWATDEVTANRHVRCYAHSCYDDMADPLLGGVTVQCILIGSVTGTFVAGEIVSDGSWSATVHNVIAGKMWVRRTNGLVLGAGTKITGATSGASVVTSSTAIGWQKGSSHWENWMTQVQAQIAAANGDPAGNAVHEGIMSSIWDSEMVPFAAGNATWASVEQIVEEWVRFVGAVRDELDVADLPWAQMAMNLRSYLVSVSVGTFPYSFIVRQAFSTLARTLPHFSLFSADDMQGHSADPLPYPGDPGSTVSQITFLRTDDYWELGLRAWRAVNNAQTLVDPGQWRPMVLFLVGGQSQAVQGIPAGMRDIDLDPDLYSSATFPGVSTVDTTVWMWNASVHQWENYDVALNGNTFVSGVAGTFSAMTAVLALRMKQRFAVAGVQIDIGFIHLPVNGSSVSSQGAANYTWDPTPIGLHQVTATMTVTVHGAGTSVDPKRGRFTASSGTPFYGWPFHGWEQMAHTGSGLGYLGSGGNDSIQWATSKIYAFDPAGTWVEIEGDFVAEAARTWKLTEGPLPVYQAAVAEIRAAMAAVPEQLQRVPRPGALFWWNGESDVNVPELYEDKLTEVLDGLEAEFSQRVRGEFDLPTVILKLGEHCPANVDQTAIDTVRAAQDAVAAARGNATTVETSDLPYRAKGIWPRPNRTDSDLHHTVRGFFMAAYRADAAAATLDGIPDHPNGELAADFGSLGGGGTPLTGTGSGTASLTGDDASSSSSSVTGATATATAASEDSAEQAVLDNLARAPDVFSYSVTKDGRSVMKQSLTQQIQLLEYLQRRRADAQGPQDTLADFS